VNDNIVSDVEEDVMKIVVLSRYTHSRPAIGFIKGFGLKRGALASTIAHDSHNIVAVGTSDEAIATAINHVIQLQGGIVVEENGQCEALPLPIAGLISPMSAADTASAYAHLTNRAHELGCTFDAPFMTLSFMALPVIPKLKMTDKGLFDTALFRHISPFTPLNS
jgi:adenine deaminase